MTKGPQKYWSRPATDVYSRKQVDRVTDRLSRLHDLNRDKYISLKQRVAVLESLLKKISNALGTEEE